MNRRRHTTLRAMHDLGLAAWFGGSLFGIAGLNAAAEQARDQRTTARITSTGWAKWSPVNTAAVAVHVVGATGLLLGNRKRAVAQKGVGSTAAAKAGVTAAAIGASVYSRLLGKKVERAVFSNPDARSTETTQAASQTAGEVAESLPVDVQGAQRQLSYVQFAVPVLTGILAILNAQAGEQQRPAEQVMGVLRRAGSVAERAASAVAA